MGNLAHNESYSLGHLFSLLSVKPEPMWKKKCLNDPCQIDLSFWSTLNSL